ncbi:terminase large subunit domain-containing protein [Moraxella equi]|uniref:Mu-like prophage FluMu protein gp28 n=1 Tax=Moraxella equi TaxID=60442 RepID=A0A378QRD5_9GAMM|nr:terminase family protein [Moraxella equi]STZ02834.1 Mu-like prophage FluMu protein gp28 [Moraxella equi]
MPANPDTARGFSANVFLDEFAFHADSRTIWKALFPVISAGFKLRVVSTPNGKGNKFYELMTNLNNKAWSRHITDIYTAVAYGLPRDIDELKEGLNDDDAWQQEYELKWLDEASAWLSYDLIDSVEQRWQH